VKINSIFIAPLWLLYLLLSTLIASAQLPTQQWSKKFGGNDTEIPYKIILTSDGGTMVVGYTDSKTGDVSPHANREYWDLWIVKLDRCGNLLWEKSYGGTGYESARDVVQTADGGFLVLGETNSTDGDVIAGYGGTKDIWLLKIDPSGTITWQKRYGGSGMDIGNQLLSLSDGNLLITGVTSSNDGDITGNHGTGGYTDALVMKLSPEGNLIWSKCFGGSKNEELLQAVISDGKIFLAGYANSTDGDIPPDQKNYDVWLLALDDSGNKIFSKIYGGSQNDVAYSMVQSASGDLVMAGYSTSIDGDLTENKGDQDYWILSVSLSGKLNWQKSLGGSEAEYANSIINDKDGGFIVGGVSYSQDGDISQALGDGDFWMAKLSAKGDLIWNQSLGGSDNDNLRSLTFNQPLGEYFVAGDSDSDDGDLDTGEGQTDIAIFKFKYTDTLQIDSLVCESSGFVSTPILLKDICGYDSAFVSYRPVVLASPLDGLNAADTIFVGGNSILPSYGRAPITWGSHPTLSCTDCPQPVASPSVTTFYTATTTLDGCTVSGQFKVVVLADASVNIPNAFTPNGDGLNDSFGPSGKVPDDYQMQIFNRYGEIVFQGSGINQRWNGTYKGQVQPSNTFVYLIRYKNIHQQYQTRKGTLTLIR